jgi:hypothetical protein
MKRAATILVLVGLALLGFWSVGYAARVTTVAETVSVPGSPGDNCSHGGNTVPCRTDPSTNGQDCEDHGNASGNEDHCAPTTNQTTQSTTTSATTGTTTHSTTTQTTATTATTHTQTTATTGTTTTTVTHPTTTTETTVTHPTTTVVTTTPTTPTTPTTQTTATTQSTTTATTTATVAGTTATTQTFVPPPQAAETTKTSPAPFVPPPLKHPAPKAAQTTQELPYTGAYAMPGIVLGLLLLMTGTLLAIFSRTRSGRGSELGLAPVAATTQAKRSSSQDDYRIVVPGGGEFASLSEAEQPTLERRWARAGDRWLGAPWRRGEQSEPRSGDDTAA